MWNLFATSNITHGFRRFMLRGKEKVTIEAGLRSLAPTLGKK
jgi:hypothetical protein